MKEDFSARIVPLEETYELAYELSREIMESELEIDVVVAIARGGMPPARFICDFLNIKRLTSIQIQHYTEGAKEKESTEIIDVPEDNLKGKSILLVDDVNDTGDTLKVATEYFQKLELKNMTTAVLHEKDNTEFPADFKANLLKKWKWLIFQWAATEDVLEFIKKEGMLDAKMENTAEQLKDKYDLEVEEGLLEKILKMKNNYYGNKDE